MGWLDQLQPASFRGVPFHVDTIDVQAGDNVVLREYPFQDLPTVFRMGDGVEEIKFSAYVIGNDYDQQRERLREVLSGAGDLMHPTAGLMRVFVAGRYTIKEAPTAEGGMARFDLTFVRAKARQYPQGQTNTQADATTKAATAKTAASDDFAAAWVLREKPGWVSEQAVARVSESVSAVWGQLAGATKGLGDFSSSAIGNYQALSTGLNDLVRTPRLLADAVVNLFALPTDMTQAAARGFQTAFAWAFNLSERMPRKPFEVSSMPAIGAGLVMYGTGKAEAAPAASAGQLQANALTAASDRLVESLAVAGYVQATAAVELSNYDEAMAMRRAVHEQMVRLIRGASAAGPALSLPASSWHAAMQGLHTAALADLQTRSRDLVRLTTYTPEGWQPVWYISYRLFGTVAYANEIMAMNPHIRHPLLVPPGRALRIVRHD